MSTTAFTETGFAPEDLWSLSDPDRYELLDGRLVERQMSAMSSIVGAEAVRVLGNFVRLEMGFRALRNDDRLQRERLAAVVP